MKLRQDWELVFECAVPLFRASAAARLGKTPIPGFLDFSLWRDAFTAVEWETRAGTAHSNTISLSESQPAPASIRSCLAYPGSPSKASPTIRRGATAGSIFFCDADYYQLYLDLLTRYAANARLRLRAYCCMPNHTHLIVTPERPMSLRWNWKLVFECAVPLS
jgi:hypothetical protein